MKADVVTTGDRPAVEGRRQQYEEQHYTVAEVASMWGINASYVRKLFRHEPGVLKLGKKAKRGARIYMTMRIPRSVLEGVHRRWQQSKTQS